MKRRAQLVNRQRSAKAGAKSLKKRVSASTSGRGSRKAGTSSKAKIGPRRTNKGTVSRANVTSKSPVSYAALGPRVVRIMGRGQFKVNSRVLKKLNQVDAAMVSLASKEKPDDVEFKKKLAELSEIVIKDGKPVPTKEIVKSDIILPSADLPLDEAKKLFTVQGVIPQF